MNEEESTDDLEGTKINDVEPVHQLSLMMKKSEKTWSKRKIFNDTGICMMNEENEKSNIGTPNWIRLIQAITKNMK